MQENIRKKYKKGYCAAVVMNTDFRKYDWLKQAAMSCEYFVLGIPEASVAAKLFGDKVSYSTDAVVDYWSNFKWIHEVVVLNEELLSYQNAYEKFQFDACFYGSLYGGRYLEDKEFFQKKDVAFVDVLPAAYKNSGEYKALELALKAYCVQRDIVLFGTGKYFEYYMECFGDRYRPAYAVDNASDKWGTFKNGVEIKNPEVLKDMNPDNVFIIICARNYPEMISQLEKMGQFEWRILLYINEMALLEEFQLYKSEKELTDEILKKIQDINYEMLREFNDICRKNGVEYSLCLGSLLGALRHKGFIPWDNDIDTFMTRANYDKLAKYADEFSDLYFWLPPSSLGKKKYFDCVPRIGYKKASIRMESSYCEYYENLYNGIHLDMFLIDKTYDNLRGRWQRFELAVLYGLMNAYRHKSFFVDYSPKMKKQNKILCAVGKYLPLQWLQKKADRVARRFNNDDKAPYYFISNDTIRNLHNLFTAEDFEHMIDVPFGDVNAMVCCGADRVCRQIFGDYMKLPPENQRVPHIGRVRLTSDLFVFQEPERAEAFK